MSHLFVFYFVLYTTAYPFAYLHTLILSYCHTLILSSSCQLYADTDHLRAWPGGTGNAKVGGNYGAAIMPYERAKELGCSQVSNYMSMVS
jgi:branched-subunit amino acid aminotransferase/4-amino-4-deoxychorismate lyase